MTNPSRFQRPTKAAIFLSTLLIGICLALGSWQIMRLQWKEGLIAELAAAQDAPPLTASELPDDAEGLKNLEFRKVRLTGVYADDREFHLIGRYWQGALGYDVLVPFLLTDTGKMILVNRGWIPLEKKDPASRPEDIRMSREITIDGLLMAPHRGSPFLPDHDIKGNVWFWYDTERMNREAGLNLPPVIVEAVELQHAPSILPIPRDTYQVELRNDHLSYAITWFALAIAGMVIFVLAHRKKDAA